jgi:hypothetical protein
MNQVIAITSEGYYHCLNPFMYLFDKYFFNNKRDLRAGYDLVICGFKHPEQSVAYSSYGWRWHTIGDQADYPATRWSDKLMHVLENVAAEQFVLLLEDYWLYRHVDRNAVNMLFDYCRQFKNVLKIDLAWDRLYVHGGSGYLYGNNTYGNVSYLDLVKSPPGADYQMSLWGGLWNREVMKKFIVPGERAQEIEMYGTHRVNQRYEDVLVLGTRQGPLLHTNVYKSGLDGPTYDRIGSDDLERMKQQRWI